MKLIKKPFFLVMILAFILTGCKNTASETKSNDTDVKSEISFMAPDWAIPPEDMLKEFEESSGVKVNILTTNWDDIRNKISTAAAGKNAAADVFEVDWAWVGEFKNAGWLEAIDLSEDDMKDFKASPTFTVDGKLYAVPYSNDYRIGYYNKAMYDAAGIKDEPKTWDDVIENAKILKEKNIVEYPISNPMSADEKSTTTFLWIAYTRNGKVFNDDGTLNEESTLDTLKLLDEINRQALSDPANRTVSEAFPKLSKGETAFMGGPSSYVIRVNDIENSKVVDQVMPIILPGKDGKASVTVPFPEAIGISPYSKNLEAAKKFVEWYTSEDIQYRLFDKISNLPTRISVIEKLLEDNKIKNPGAMLELAKKTESPFPNGVPMYYTKMSVEIYNTINEMANEKITAEEAAKKLVENVNKIVAENK